MRGHILKLAVLIACVVTALESVSFAQSSSDARFGVGLKVSTLGIGVEGATRVTENSNVRAGFNWFGYNNDFTRNRINYGARLELRSFEAHYDWFLGHGFRVSPGVLLWNGNRLDGTASVPAGQQFTLGNQQYSSGSSDPVRGPITIDFSKHKVSPLITAGFGNLLRRTGSRVSLTVEGGVLLQGDRESHLNLTGSVGATPLGPFQSVNDPAVQASIRAEENKINQGLPPYDEADKVLRYYPVVSVGIGFRLK
jgi:hypothetical protein